MLKPAYSALNREACHQPEHEPSDQRAEVPGNTELRMDDQVVTYARLDDATARLAQMMITMGVGPGDRIGLMVPNVPEFGLVFYAALRSGAVTVLDQAEGGLAALADERVAKAAIAASAARGYLDGSSARPSPRRPRSSG
jgi:acyl-coenzyme A synthetase/AMP-(fatty) acid ligase